jgi:DNA-binding NarL/FixJ family response regulator
MQRNVTQTRRRRETASSRELTPREKTIVTMVATGYTTKQIASMLGLSVKTVETHRTTAMHKTGAYCLALLVRYAVRVGLIEA